MRVLVELRPALEGYAGIPQETRLLFRSLLALGGVQASGLLQSASRLLPAGVPGGGAGVGIGADEVVERMGRLVMALDHARGWRGDLEAGLQTVRMAIASQFGARIGLTGFDGRYFRDYLWQRLFAKTLPPEDIGLVTGADYRVVRLPWAALQICARFTSRFGAPVFGCLDTSGFDLMIAETPYPASVAPGTQLVVRYHDAIPLTMPHTISDNEYHHATHYLALRHNVRSGAWFACVSDATRADLVSIFPQAEARSVTIPNMISGNFFAEPASPARVPEIIAAHASDDCAPLPGGEGDAQYLLMVSSIEPRKNHLALLSAWEQLRAQAWPALKLVIVGGIGWHNEPILRRFRPWMQRGELQLLRNVAPGDLRRLYRHALATVCPSTGEGFDFSGIEAMSSGGAVVASSIPVHREIYADAADYFDPYSAADLAAAIGRVMSAPDIAHREELVSRGAVVARRYEPRAVMPLWEAFLRKVAEVA